MLVAPLCTVLLSAIPVTITSPLLLVLHLFGYVGTKGTTKLDKKTLQTNRNPPASQRCILTHPAKGATKPNQTCSKYQARFAPKDKPDVQTLRGAPKPNQSAPKPKLWRCAKLKSNKERTGLDNNGDVMVTGMAESKTVQMRVTKTADKCV